MLHFIGNKRLIQSELYKESTVEECLEYFKNHESIEVDTETTGRDCHSYKILSLQIGDSENQWMIDTRVINILLFKELLESKLCIFQNAKFDYKGLKKAGIVIENIYDTMLAECIIYCGYEKFGYGLKDIAKRYLDIDLDKTTRGEFHKITNEEFTDNQIEYACLDVTYLHKIRDKQLELIKKYDLEYCLNLENQVVKALADIEYNGIYLDRENWLKITNESKSKLANIQLRLDEVIMNDINLSKAYKPKYVQTNLFDFEERELDLNYASSAQMKKLFKVLGEEVDSTDDRQLTKLKSKHKFFEVLGEFREVAKVVSTYGEGFLKYINPNTNRVHTDFWQIKNTGRVSSGSKDMNSPNMQNIPADNKFRNCFKARKGFKWVSIDYSGQEMRLMADASGEQGFIDILNSNKDLHCYVGSMMFGREIDPIKDKSIRTKIKTINFGKAYGMGPPKLADSLSISIEESQELFSMYEKSFPVLNGWLYKQGQFAKQNMYSKTFSPCKRRRWYPDMQVALELRKTVQRGDKETWKKILTIEGQTERNGGNQPIQGSGSDVCKEALIEVRKLINTKYHNQAYLIGVVHDAIDVEVREDLAEQFSKEMAEIMIGCGNKYVSKVKMDVDITITDFWYK